MTNAGKQLQSLRKKVKKTCKLEECAVEFTGYNNKDYCCNACKLKAYRARKNQAKNQLSSDSPKS